MQWNFKYTFLCVSAALFVALMAGCQPRVIAIPQNSDVHDAASLPPKSPSLEEEVLIVTVRRLSRAADEKELLHSEIAKWAGMQWNQTRPSLREQLISEAVVALNRRSSQLEAENTDLRILLVGVQGLRATTRPSISR